MSRHGGRGADGDSKHEAWPDSGYEGAGYDQAGPRRSRSRPVSRPGRGRGVTSAAREPDSRWEQAGPPWDRTAPPWEQAGWEGEDGTPPRVPREGLTVGHPSGPLPPLPGDDGPPGRRAGRGPAAGYPGDMRPGGGVGRRTSLPGQTRGPRSQGAGPSGVDRPGVSPPADGGRGSYTGTSYEVSGYPAPGPWDGVRSGAGGHGRGPRDDGDWAGARGFHAGRYRSGDYPGGGFPGGAQAGEEYPGGGYDGEEYLDGEFDGGEYPDGEYDGGEYPDGEYDGGEYPDGEYGGEEYPEGGYTAVGYADGFPGARYPGEGDEGYPGRQAGRAVHRGARDSPGAWGADANRGYRPGRGWHGDAGHDRVAEGGYGSGFLPGLADDDSPGPGTARDTEPERRGRSGRTRRRGMRRLAPWLALAVVVLLVGVVAGAGYHVWSTYLHPPDYSGPGTGSVVVQIMPGDTATEVGIRLQRLGVVESARAFANAAKASSRGNSLEPGYYRVRKHMKASLAFALLLKPSSRVQYQVLIPEGWRVSQIVTALGTKTGKLAAYQQAIKDTSALGLPSYAHGNPQGFLFPATYPVQPGTLPVHVLGAMVQRFDKEAASLNLVSGAAHDGVTPQNLVTIASLVQAEGMRPQDLPKIARVIYNRLNAKMRLQLDSTVRFAMHSQSAHLSTGVGGDTSFKSPYNTYLHTGLPPGPIDCPGDAALRAALHPARGNWLYFLTVNTKTGLTKFTSSYSQFLQYKAELQQTQGG